MTREPDFRNESVFRHLSNSLPDKKKNWTQLNGYNLICSRIYKKNYENSLPKIATDTPVKNKINHPTDEAEMESEIFIQDEFDLLSGSQPSIEHQFQEKLEDFKRRNDELQQLLLKEDHDKEILVGELNDQIRQLQEDVQDKLL
ncbi:hypothetical protein HHI36_012894 [Cryptolaemus montrouzieri]|uniref:Uncharacterized protein n=1 Tax=Cryptolaemus montrouzieri TaxID=559131 RepID=A0ABD2NGL9_9CUCU